MKPARILTLVAALVAAFSFVAEAQTAVGPHPISGIAFGGVDDDVTTGILIGNGGGIPPAFDFNPASAGSGWSKAGDSLVVNGTTMTLIASCDETKVSGTNLNCVDALGATVVFPEVSTGTAPAIDKRSYFSDATDGVLFSTAGKYYQRASRTLVNGTDYVVEVLFRTSPTANRALIGNATTTAVAGFSLTTTTTQVSIRIGDGTTNNANGATVLGGTQRINHAIAYVDDDNLCGVCANGSCSTATSNAAVGDWTSTSDTLGLGGFGGGPSSTYASTIYGWRIWQCPVGNLNCMAGATNQTEFGNISRERASKIFGTAPSIASTAALAIPTTMTRASDAFVDVIKSGSPMTRALWPVGLHAPRIATRAAGGTLVTGYLIEPQQTNLALQSEDLATTWAAISVGDNVLTNAFAGADLTTTGDDIDCSALTTDCGVRQAVTLTAATYTLSAWARGGQGSWVALRDNTVANAVAFFDTTACAACNVANGDCTSAVGTVGAGVIQARANPWPLDTDGNGTVDATICRMSISFTGTVAAHNIDLLCADGDNDLSIVDGDATANCGFWGIEAEQFPTMSSYQSTTTASVTRSGDDLRFDGTGHYSGSPTTMDAQVLCANFDIETSNTFASVGTSTTNYGRLGINATSDRAHTDGANAGAQWDFSASSGDVADGSTHKLRGRWVTNDIEGFFDTATFGTDATAVMPTSAASSIFLGTRGSTAQQPGCLLTRLRLWPQSLTPTVAP